MGSIIATIALGFAAIVGGMVARELPKAKPAAPAAPVVETAAIPSDVSSVALATTSSIALDDAKYKHAKVSIGDKAFEALVSDTDSLRELGLSGRLGLEKGQVMLFVFDKPEFLGFWMKDMLFSIDMLWLDADHRVVSWKENVSPSTYPEVFYPASLSKYVIELPAGALSALGISAGDFVSIDRGK